MHAIANAIANAITKSLFCFYHFSSKSLFLFINYNTKSLFFNLIRAGNPPYIRREQIKGLRP